MLEFKFRFLSEPLLSFGTSEAVLAFTEPSGFQTVRKGPVRLALGRKREGTTGEAEFGNLPNLEVL